jgi:hypothetical protein
LEIAVVAVETRDAQLDVLTEPHTRSVVELQFGTRARVGRHVVGIAHGRAGVCDRAARRTAADRHVARNERQLRGGATVLSVRGERRETRSDECDTECDERTRDAKLPSECVHDVPRSRDDGGMSFSFVTPFAKSRSAAKLLIHS